MNILHSLLKAGLTAFIFVLFAIKVYGQPYPVTTSVQLGGPTIPYYDGFTIATDNKVFFTVTLNDITKPSYNVRLKITISGANVTLSTSYNFKPTPLTLYYNVPVVLTGADLADYFNPDNVDFYGITKEEFLKYGKLPEGIYSICIEALDYNRYTEPPVSNKACATGIVQEHDPPVIITCIGEQELVVPQNYLFSWQPMHMGGFPVEYELQIFELPEGQTPDQVLQYSTPPTISKVVSTTNYWYQPSDPPLATGIRYIIQVQIRDLSGNNTFKNNGYSKYEIFSISSTCEEGKACDDFDDCTINDALDKNCNCVGIPLPDTDQDGICDNLDICANGNDKTDIDGDCIPDACDDCVIGGQCDDGVLCTTNDVYSIDSNGNCTCAGTVRDGDGDGICDMEDSCPNGSDKDDSDGDGVPDGCDSCTEGQPCDDGNIATINDIVVWDTQYSREEILPEWITPCLCKGTPCAGDPALDADRDGICDELDPCPKGSNTIDSDGDTVPDGCDTCPIGDDRLDADSDGIPDACDCNLPLSIGVTVNAAKACDFCNQINLSLATDLIIAGVSVVLPNGQPLVLNSSVPEFTFPYTLCYGNCNGPSLIDLAKHINIWLQNHNYTGSATASQNDLLCTGNAFSVKKTTVQFISIILKKNIVSTDEVLSEFKLVGCQDLSSGTIELFVEPVNNSSIIAWSWSNGAVTPTIIVTPPVGNYAVTVTQDKPVLCKDVAYITNICMPGTPCDDYYACTTNDVYDLNCRCSGTYVGDDDGDGVCNTQDQCPGFNDYFDNDHDNVPDACDTCKVGTPCNDGVECTINDRYDQHCNCGGQYVDSDQDGICDPIDLCAGFPDHIDTDRDGIPDGCDESICNLNLSSLPPYNELELNLALLKSYCGCSKIQRHTKKDLIDFQNLISGQGPANESLLGGINDGPEQNDAELISIEDSDYNYMYSLIPSQVWNIDSDGDGIWDYIDLTPCSPDNYDNKGEIPCDYKPCETALIQPNLTTILQIVFDPICDDGDPCTENDQIDCNCVCKGVPVDTDHDGVPDCNDRCNGFPDSEDRDHDGIPDGCDLDGICPDEGKPCNEPVADPAPDPDHSLQISKKGIWQYDYESMTCICKGIPCVDSDDDGICDFEDICPGANNNLDADADEIPDGCDLCPDFPGNIGQTCNDGDPCTIDDVITEDCLCAGRLMDTDNDGVCNGLDICEGFDDANAPDYDSDGIPDGCDPPWFEIGCPISLKLIDGYAKGVLLTFPGSEITPENVPDPISLKVMYGNQLFEKTAIRLSGVRTVSESSNANYEVYYEIAELPVSEITAVDFAAYTVSYSEHQSCMLDGRKDAITVVDNNSIRNIGCPTSFTINAGGQLVLQSANNGAVNLFEVPESLTATALQLGNYPVVEGTFLITATVIGTEGAPHTQQITVPGFPTNAGALNALSGTLTYSNGLVCSYQNGQIAPLTGCPDHYLGEPCSDNNPLTHSDAYNSTCECVGISGHDADGDGVHDAIDQCPGSPDNIDVNPANGVPDGCECPTPVLKDFTLIAGNDMIIELDGNGASEYSYYTFKYKRSGEAEFMVLDNLTERIFTVSNMFFDVDYEVEISAHCKSGFVSSAYIANIYIQSDEENHNCGIAPNINIDNQSLLTECAVGDTLTAGDFKIIITEVSGGNGTFSGQGYIFVPYFNKARVNVSFNGVTFNEEKQLVSGEIKITGAGLALLNEDAANALSSIIAGLETLDDVLAEAQQTVEAIEEIIQTIGGYLPAEVTTQLQAAQAALKQCDESGSETDCAAAQQALVQANEAYHDAMVEFLDSFFDIMKAIFTKLKNRCDNDWGGLTTLETAYNNAKTTIETNHDAELEDLENTVLNGDGIEDYTIIEYTFIRTSTDINLGETFTTNSTAFYAAERKYMTCLALDKLLDEVDTDQEAFSFATLFLNTTGFNVLKYIGPKMQDAGMPIADPTLKAQAVETIAASSFETLGAELEKLLIKKGYNQ